MPEAVEAGAGIRSLDSGLRLLEILRDRPSLSVNEAAKLLGTAPSTAHRLLGTLKARGFVAQDPATRRYRAGSALLDIAFDALRNLDVRRISRHHLEALAFEQGETTNLIVLERTSIRYMEVAESTQQLRAASRVGETRPAHGTASGKVLLAALTDAQVEALYPDEALAPMTPHTVRTRRELLKELAAVREQGFAVATEEGVAGITAIAVPLHEPLGRVVAALTLAGPSSRLPAERIEEVARATLRHAAAIDEDLRRGGQQA
jgi:DNA-binding IclR family transcriptional regulator